VPPYTDPDTAHQIMMRAALRENADTVEDLLRAGIQASVESTVDAWEAEGGHIPQQAVRGTR